jgi:hypothetical protein
MLHPDDVLPKGEWAGLHWDLVVDLGWAGSHCYAQWSQALGCQVRGLYEFGEWRRDIYRVMEALQFGQNWLVDGEGIDWWNLIAPTRCQQLFELMLVRKLSRELSGATHFHATRPHRLANALGRFLNTRVNSFLPAAGRVSGRLERYVEAFQSLTWSQMGEIALDKWDTDYGLRRFFARKERKRSSAPLVLLPSAYKNVSRVLSAYASMLPDIQFLLVTTRQGCAIDDLAANVDCVSLASYAPVPRNEVTEREIASLTERWAELEGRIRRSEELAPVYPLDSFENFQAELRNGLRIRDAWRSVLEHQRISSVLCGDENNLYTRLPVLLAKKRGIRTVYCSHGALDANVLIRGICSDTYLAKGEMERDYLIRQCGVPEGRVFIGAPIGRPALVDKGSAPDKSQIVFFSEPYELYSGRAESLYRELLPRLCSIARGHGRKIMVKLHPFESLSARRQLVERVLTGENRDLVVVTKEPVSDELFRRTWFSLTVESSVAVECALNGVPCFLCGWFDLGLYGYGQQYEKYGAARTLDGPEDIQRIPEFLHSSQLNARIRQGVYQPLAPKQLEAILLGAEDPHIAGVRVEGVRSSLPARS